MGTLCAQLLILLKLYRYFGHGLKMYMWFGYNPQVIFVTFSQAKLGHFSGFISIKVNR